MFLHIAPPGSVSTTSMICIRLCRTVYNVQFFITTLFASSKHCGSKNRLPANLVFWRSGHEFAADTRVFAACSLHQVVVATAIWDRHMSARPA